MKKHGNRKKLKSFWIKKKTHGKKRKLIKRRKLERK